MSPPTPPPSRALPAIATSVAVALAACAGDPKPSANVSSPPANTSAPVVVKVANVAPPIAAKPDAAAPAVEVDLLHWTPAAVSVSSNVQNPRDYPHHLVDNKPDTAWNGKTGDLNAEITFRVPKETHVKRIDLSCGFDKSGPKGDFFTMNHRITKVKVSKVEKVTGSSSTNDVVIGEFTLDPNERKPQRIPIDKPGGVFLIKVLETIPGTKKEWRELTISEMHVMGDPGPRKLAHTRMPEVVIGSRVDDEEPRVLTTQKANLDSTAHLPIVATSTADACARWEKIVTPIFGTNTSEAVYPGPPDKPYCKVSAPVALPAGSRARALRTVTLKTIDAVEEHLLIETDQGAVIPRDALLREQSISYSLTKTAVKLERGQMEGSDVAASISRTNDFEFYCGAGDTSGPTRQYLETIDFDLRCNLEAKPLTCSRQERKRQCRGPDCTLLGYAPDPSMYPPGTILQ